MPSLMRRVVPWDEKLPDGLSADEALRNLSPDRMSGVASSPQSATPRAVALPQTSSPLAAPTETDPYADARNPAIPSLSNLKAPPTMIERNQHGRPVAIVGGDDPIQSNMELIRAQEGYKAPRSTKDLILSLVTGGVPGAIAYATDQDTRNKWAVGGDIAKEEGQINRDLGVQSRQAGIEAQKYRPIYQQRQQDIAQQRADQGDVRLDQGQQRVDQGQQRVDQGDVRLDRSAPVDVDIDGQTFKVAPQVAARIKSSTSIADNNRDVRVSEGQKNRDARKANVDAIIKAATNRQDKEISSRIAAMGDPQEIYGAASDIWQQAVEKETQAKSMRIGTTADVATKKQLLDDAAKLKETVTKMQQEARKASSAGRRGTPQASPTVDKPETRKGKISQQQQQLWLSHNPSKTLDDMKKVYPNAVMQ